MSLPPDRARRLFLCLDALHYSATIADFSHSRTIEVRQIIESIIAEPTPARYAIQLFSDAWSIIDALHRYRVVLSSIPGPFKNASETRVFLSKTSLVEPLRHYVQHITNEINNNIAARPPLWGSLSWISGNDPSVCISLPSGNGAAAHSVVGLVFDRETKTYVRRFELHAGDTSIDLDSVVHSLKSFDQMLFHWANTIKGEDGFIYKYRPEQVTIFRASFQSIEPIQADAEGQYTKNVRRQ